MLEEIPSNRENSKANNNHTLIKADIQRKRRATIIIAIILFVLLALIITSLILLLSPTTNQQTVTRLRDVFIIFMAFESLLIGFALIILMVQISILINLVNNEIKPILNSTNETFNNLKGTTTFLSNNLVEPVMKLNEYFAGFQEVLKIFRLKRKKT